MNKTNIDRKRYDSKIKLDKKRYIVSKTDLDGMITYGNDYFVEISGYLESELIGRAHNILRHPDMPSVIFKLLWDNIKLGLSITVITKNLAKDGRYYWVSAVIEPRYSPIDKKIIGYNAYRKGIKKDIIDKVSNLYVKLKQIEDESGIEGSEHYLNGYLEENGITYNKYFNKLAGNTGIFKSFFSSMKKKFL